MSCPARISTNPPKVPWRLVVCFWPVAVVRHDFSIMDRIRESPKGRFRPIADHRREGKQTFNVDFTGSPKASPVQGSVRRQG